MKVKVKGPNMCYIFEKHGIQGYQIWHSHVSNVKYTNKQIHKYTNTQIRKYTNKQIGKYTNTKCLKDPTCAIILKCMGFKDIIYDIPMYQM